VNLVKKRLDLKCATVVNLLIAIQLHTNYHHIFHSEFYSKQIKQLLLHKPCDMQPTKFLGGEKKK